MMKPDRDEAVGNAFHAASLGMVMTNRTAILEDALEAMRTALQLLDGVEAYMPAARLQHAIDIAEREIELSDANAMGTA